LRKKQEGIEKSAAEAARAEKEISGAAIRKGSFGSQGALVMIRGREGEADGLAGASLLGRRVRDIATSS